MIEKYTCEDCGGYIKGDVAISVARDPKTCDHCGGTRTRTVWYSEIEANGRINELEAEVERQKARGDLFLDRVEEDTKTAESAIKTILDLKAEVERLREWCTLRHTILHRVKGWCLEISDEVETFEDAVYLARKCLDQISQGEIVRPMEDKNAQ